MKQYNIEDGFNQFIGVAIVPTYMGKELATFKVLMGDYPTLIEYQQAVQYNYYKAIMMEVVEERFNKE